jgi:hypothetical protein
MHPPPKMPLRRWQARTHRLMSNRKQILKGKSGGERVLLWPERFRLRHQPPAISFNGSLEYARDRHLRRRPRRPVVGADPHNESPIGNTAAGFGRLAHDQSTSSLL